VAGHDRGLAAVHGGDGGLDRARQRAVAGQRQLGVEHHAPGAPGDGRGRGVQADAALHPHRPVASGGHQPLQQDEGGLLADPSPGLGSLGHQPGRPGCERRFGLGQRRHLDQHALQPATEVAQVVEPAQPVVRPHRERHQQRGRLLGQQDGQPAGCDPAGAGDAGVEADAEGTVVAVLDQAQLRPGPGGVAPELDHPQSPRSADGDDQASVRTQPRIDTNDQLAVTPATRHGSPRSQRHGPSIVSDDDAC
jgi:hypothetical protein